MLAPVNEPVPIRNLSALSSQPINALSEEPLSRTIPISFAGVPDVPVPNSISLSAIVEFVVSNVVVVPFTSRLPVIVTLPVAATSANVTSSDVATACPIETAVPETDTPVPAVSVVTLAVPSKLTPLIVLAVARAVAVAALPEVSCVPDVLTPGKFMFAEPSNDTPPIFLAVSKAVAVAALPVVSWFNVPTTKSIVPSPSS